MSERKGERNKKIVELIDSGAMSYREVQRKFRLKSVGTVYGIYTNEKRRAELSTE